jgi:hypothetical protein
MLKQHLSPASLYRLVANAAVAYLAGGDLLFGSHLLDKALELCPTYDFAHRQQQMVEDGEYIGAAFASLGNPEELEQRLKNFSERLAPPQSELRKFTDEELLEQFAGHGVTITPKTMKHTAALYADQSVFVNNLLTALYISQEISSGNL